MRDQVSTVTVGEGKARAELHLVNRYSARPSPAASLVVGQGVTGEATFVEVLLYLVKVVLMMKLRLTEALMGAQG
jgi:hypothetical protein